jgi:cell pole-organizing protein PopZ
MAQENEASVEEILESIKKVIARDNRDSALDARRRRQADADLAAEKAAQRMSEAEQAEEREEILDLADMELAAAEDAADQDQNEPLVRHEALSAMQENLAALAMLAQPGAKPQIVRSGETSLEGLTRDLLRPMLAEWLDKNLPGMVEQMVQAEIARIAGKRG